MDFAKPKIVQLKSHKKHTSDEVQGYSFKYNAFHKLCNIFGLMNCIHAFGMWHVILDLEYYCIYNIDWLKLRYSTNVI